ncbi:hypothetical protein [Porphyrobacter sp. YT40]|uniref:hypothetical protein n=1 Tax=Porphyrobacter sp. YT40 TaxID=2547601 RepID=UPI0015E8A43B|nr:hypothetical protein [Porphyrobacter sp. YT40]
MNFWPFIVIIFGMAAIAAAIMAVRSPKEKQGQFLLLAAALMMLTTTLLLLQRVFG